MIYNARKLGGILMEAILVAGIGGILAFAANQFSPRGLDLNRNYFPTGTNKAVRSAGGVPPGGVIRTNSMTLSAEQLLAAQMRQEGLQLIDGRQAQQLFHESQLSRKIVLIDARDQSQYLESHIPGAHEFDPYHPEKYFPDILPICQTAEKIVVYCNGGDCDDSQTAAILLKDVGIPTQKLFIYGGGMTEWTNSNLPVQTGPLNGENTSKLRHE